MLQMNGNSLRQCASLQRAQQEFPEQRIQGLDCDIEDKHYMGIVSEIKKIGNISGAKLVLNGSRAFAAAPLLSLVRN